MNDSSSTKLSASELLQHGYRFALSLTHSPHDAEDLVQQSWLKLSRAYGEVNSKSVLFRTIKNLLTDQYRRGKVVVFEPLAKEETDAESDSPHLANDPGFTEPGVEGDLDSLLAHLNHREREILYLNCVESYTASEIAEMINSNRNTVLSLLARSKKKLRDLALRDQKREDPS